MTEQDVILADIGRKCADDVSDAINRNMKLAGGQRGALIIAAYATAASCGATTGAFAAYEGKATANIDADDIDAVWTQFIRPMMLGKLINTGDTQ
jgi:hypothetical protein